MTMHKSALTVLCFIFTVSFADGTAAQSNGKETIFFAGATGSIGRIAIGMLNEKGFNVRGMTRNPARAESKFGSDYEWVRGDVRDPQALVPLMAGADYVICSISYTEFEGPNGPQFVDYMGVRNLVDAAVANNIKHFVLVSAGSSGPYREHRLNPRFGYVAYWKTKAEGFLKESGLSFTIVGPGGFLSEPGGVKGLKIFPRSEYELGNLAREDVAAVVVESLTNPDARNKAFAVQQDESFEPGAWRDMFADLKPE